LLGFILGGGARGGARRHRCTRTDLRTYYSLGDVNPLASLEK
jgi:hypothetical protein